MCTARNRAKQFSRITLRTVLTKYKGPCARLGPCRKSRSVWGLLESTKKNGVSHAFFEIISLESQQKYWHQYFSEKKRKRYFFTNFLRMSCFDYRWLFRVPTRASGLQAGVLFCLLSFDAKTSFTVVIVVKDNLLGLLCKIFTQIILGRFAMF